MKCLILFYCLLYAAALYGQAPCATIKGFDAGIVMSEKPLYHKLRRFDAGQLPDSVQTRMQAELTAATSPAFFSRLRLAGIKVYDSLVKKNRFEEEPLYDSAGNETEYLYVVVYEIKLNKTIPFRFRLDFTREGKLFRKEQLPEGIADENKQIISCDRASAIGLADSKDRIGSVTDIYLLYHTTHKTIIWQLSGPGNPQTGIRYIKTIDAYTGKVIDRGTIQAMRPGMPGGAPIIKDLPIE